MEDCDKSSLHAMTWLEAAEQILRMEGPEMHIKDLTDRVMRLNMVNSSCKTSLETLLYRQTQKENSKFERVVGKMGWFRLKDSDDVSPSSIMSALFLPMMDDDDDVTPKGVVVRRKRKLLPQADRSDSSGDNDSGDTSDDEGSEELYHKKYKFLKGIAKRMIFENAALAEKLESLEEEIQHVQVQKRFLLRRLLELKNKEGKKAVKAPAKPQLKKILPASTGHSASPSLTPASTTAKASSISGIARHKKQTAKPAKAKEPPAQQHKLAPPTTTTAAAGSFGGKGLNKPHILEPSDLFSSGSSSISDDEIMDVSTVSSTSQKGSGGVRKGGNKADEGKKKRVRRIQSIPQNDDGTPLFPIQIGGLKVHSLGKVVFDRPTFHSERYIWPVGFHSMRSYPSMTDPTRRCLYSCKILDGGEAPIFEMVPQDNLDCPVQASSATACHHAVLKAINKARDKQASNAGSGPEFFGFSHPTILNLIQNLPDADKCTKFKRMSFEGPLKRSTKSKTSGTKKRLQKLSSIKSLKKGTSPKPFYITPAKGPTSPLGDPSLAPVIVNRQLSTLGLGLDSSSGLSSDSDESGSDSDKLVIDMS